MKKVSALLRKASALFASARKNFARARAILKDEPIIYHEERWL